MSLLAILKRFTNSSAVLLVVLFPLLVSAQTATPTPTVMPTPVSSPEEGTLVTEGVAGEMDLHRRGPVLTVTIQHVAQPKHVTLLADAYVPNEGFAKYPIRFDFFINRKLFATQYRSTTLPGAVGVDVGEDVAVSPFNFSVVATVLHPNRQFTTIMEGASEIVNQFSPALQTLDCTITIQPADSSNSADAADFVGNLVSPSLQPDNSWLLSFDGKSTANNDTAAIKATVKLDSNSDGSDIKATTAVVVTSNGATKNYSLIGAATVSSGLLKILEVSDDAGNRLLCE